MKIGIISQGYPSADLIYNYGFVHARAKLYKQYGHKVIVYCISRIKITYIYEGIIVFYAPKETLLQLIKNYKPDIICSHAPANLDLIDLTIKTKLPTIVWIHGFESLVHFLYYPITWRVFPLICWTHATLLDFRRLREIKKLYEYLDNHNGYIIFPSKWMLDNAEKSTKTRIENFCISPNPIDLTKFSYHRHNNEIKPLCLRYFSSTKYAVDIAIKGFRYTYNPRFDLYLHGNGYLLPVYARLIRKYASRVILHTEMYNHNQLPNIFKDYTVMVMPSRVDAQGVSMCEFMATGKPVISSNIGGVDEFIKHGHNGFLINNKYPYMIQHYLNMLSDDKQLYNKMSENARKFAEQNLDGKSITKFELALMENVINGWKKY